MSKVLVLSPVGRIHPSLNLSIPNMSFLQHRPDSTSQVSYGPPWAHYLGGYQDRLLSGPLGLLGLCHTAPDGVRRKDCGGEVLG
jgi:hypothetical protein